MISFKKKNTKILSYQKDIYLILKKLIIFRIFFFNLQETGHAPQIPGEKNFLRNFAEMQVRIILYIQK